MKSGSISMTMWKKIFLCGVVMTSAAFASVASAQEAPAPRKMPRVPVAQQLVAGTHTPAPPSRTVEGSATILDTERFRVNDIEVRLFGVVPPQLSAPFGPQARAVLDSMNAASPVTCTIRDRDRDGRFLATCLNANKQDFSMELLRRGLAVTARGSLRPTDLSGPYVAAEQAAQAQKLGLWSVNVPQAASDSSIRDAAKAAAAAAAQAKEEKEAQAAREAAAKAEAQNPPAVAPAAPQPEAAPVPVSVPVQATNLKADTSAGKAPIPAQKPDLLPQPVGPTPDEIQAVFGTSKETVMSEAPAMDFFERYQILLTGLLMALTVLGVGASIFFHRILEKREERRSVAAAIRGELMAARAVCLARLQTMTDAADDKAAQTWPKIRVLVFQAYVGRLGYLGAELSRQIASIYGLASDYAAYYAATTGDAARQDPITRRQSLQTLVRHIDDVLPSLASMDRSKRSSLRRKMSFLRWKRAKATRTQSLKKDIAKPVEPSAPVPRDIPRPKAALPKAVSAAMSSSLPEREDMVLAQPQPQPQSQSTQPTILEKKEPVADQPKPVKLETPNAKVNKADLVVLSSTQTSFGAEAPLSEQASALLREQSLDAAEPLGSFAPDAQPSDSETAADSADQITPGSLWGMLRKLASEHKDRSGASTGDYMPDYANLSDAEMEALAYGGDPLDDGYSHGHSHHTPAASSGGRRRRR